MRGSSICYTWSMTKFGWLVVAVVVLAIGGVASFFYLAPPNAVPPEPAATSGENLEGQSIYASGEYGFTLRYPSAATLSEDFSTFYHLPAEWRANGPANATGTPLLQIVGYETSSENSFPRYYTAMVRVGVSAGEKEVASCEKIVPDQGETTLADAEIGGETWKAFSFQNAGMMQYVKGVSYRVVHNGTCYVMEKLATGSSYQDDPDTEKDVPQATLDAAYGALDPIVESFTFSR